MKKITFLFLFALSFAGISNAQTFKIIKTGDTHILNDSTIYVYGATGTTLEVFLDIINSGSTSEMVSTRRDIISEVSGTTNSFCWGVNCYSPAVDSSPSSNAQSIGAGDTLKGTNEFTGEYNAAVTGTTTIRYSFFSYVNRSDSSWVIVVYNATPAGIQSISNINLSVPYPNPASTLVNFNYSLSGNIQSGNLKIFNMLGDCIQALPLTTSKRNTVVDVKSMPSGIYICEIEASGCKPSYQKLIVAH